jgi:signal transduction histidine kinase
MHVCLSVLAAVSLAALPPSMPDQVPELMHRVILPVTPHPPSCIDVSDRPSGEPDLLLVGLVNGTIDVFYPSGNEMVVRVFQLDRAAPVEAIRAVRLPGPRSETAIVALQGRTLSVLKEGTPGVRDRLRLPPPHGRYELTRVGPRPQTQGEEPHDRLLLYDDERVLEVSIGTATNRWGLSVEIVLDDPEGLSVRPLSDRAVIAARTAGVHEFTVEEGLFEARSGSAERQDSGLIIPLSFSTSADSLSFLVKTATEGWVERRTAAPDSLTLAMTVRDTMLLIAGAVTDDPDRNVGWLALLDREGRVDGFSEHGRPVSAAAGIAEWIAVQGERRNLSLYDGDLSPVWDNASQIRPVAMLPIDLDEDASRDLIVVGSREFHVDVDDAELIRDALDRQRFMEGAVRREGSLVLDRPMLVGFRSNAGRLESIIRDGLRQGRELERSGEYEEAARSMLTSRAAAATLGRRELAGELREEGARLLSMPRRERATLAAIAVLLLPGLLWGVLHISAAPESPTRAPLLAGLTLLAVGVVVWSLLGHVSCSPGLMAGGGVLLGAVAVNGFRAAQGVRAARVPGAAVEELEIGIAEFTHGGREGSEGRRSITKLALFAQEMLESFDEPEHFEALRERLAVRAKAFYPAKYDTALELPEHAKAAGMAVENAEALAAAAERIRAAVDTALSGDTLHERELRRALHDIVDGRSELAESADRARELVRANPGCSVRACVTRVLDEKEEMLRRQRVEVDLMLGIDEREDAVAIKRRDLYFVIENLVTNASKAMEGTQRRHLEFRGTVAPPFYELRVTDSGCGMPESMIGTLFTARETDGESGGFGLPNSREKLRRVGGDIAVEWTRPGEGTRFLVALPLWTPNTKGGPA